MQIQLSFKKKLNEGLNSFELNVNQVLGFGDFLAISGKSGAGKTTILRVLSGLDVPDSGFIKVGDDVWLDGKFSLSSQKRKIGFVFQDYALFAHLSVWKNIVFGVENKKDVAFAKKMVQIMQLDDILGRSIGQISGGQAQRVALARALARQPKILILDEPLSALDSQMRSSLQELLLRIHREFGLTSILVSHDISEILRLANLVWVLKQGSIVKSGDPFEIFARRSLSAKVQLYGEILRIQKQGFFQIVDVMCENQILRVLDERALDSEKLKVGDKVLLVAKAFSPMIVKI